MLPKVVILCNISLTIADVKADSAYLTNLYTSNREILNANSSRNISLLYKWLYECIDDREHQCCRKSLSNTWYDDHEGERLPSRVIDVGKLDGSEAPRLLITKGEKGRYIALSHRWGQGPRTRLTTDRVDEFVQALPMGELSLTFKDAVQATRNLGISYLWIDSLCIIQDDRGDWENEAARMGLYFEKAICTLAAVDAVDDNTNQDVGLFSARETDELAVTVDCPFEDDGEEPPTMDDPCWEGRMERLIFSSALPSNKDIVLRPRWKGLWATMRFTTWHDRAWIVQERVLSRRVIYYTGRKLFWECQKISADEENMEANVSPLRGQFLESLGSMLQASKPISPWKWLDYLSPWRYMVTEYSGSNLTRETDKLLAFHGVCERLSSRIGRQIYLGTILDGTGGDLLWARKDEASGTYAEFHAPSWSWLSFKGQITHSFSTLNGTCRLDLAQMRVVHLRACTTDDRCRAQRCGMLTFTTTFQHAIVAEFLEQWPTLTNDELIHVLGSTVHSEPYSIPRAEDSTVSIPRRELTLPPKVQVLRDRKTRRIMGWFVGDRPGKQGDEHEILCAHVMTWRADGRPAAANITGRIEGFEYFNERNVDLIGLEVASEHPRRYRRIGRGRIVMTGRQRCSSSQEFCLL